MPCSEIPKCHLKSPKRATKFEAVALIVRFGFSSEDVGRKQNRRTVPCRLLDPIAIVIRAYPDRVDRTLDPLIPAKAGIQGSLHEDWVPASAGTNGETDST